MSNPWTKKNPLVSMWLSAANRSIGTARGQATTTAKRQIAKAQKDAIQSMFSITPAKSTPTSTRKKIR